MFDAKGKFVRRVARAGHGPGELEFLNGLAAGENDEVVVSDPGNARFSFYSAGGQFLRQTLSASIGFGDFWSRLLPSFSPTNSGARGCAEPM